MSEPIMRVQAAVTGRDLVLLGWLADHGVLTTEQIAVALFPSANFAQRRLRALFGMRLIDRFRPQRAEGGTYPYHWLLAPLGVDVVAAQRGEPVPRRDHARQRRWHLTNRANLPHLLGTNSFFTALAGYARIHPNAQLQRWWPAARCQQRAAFVVNHLDAQAFLYEPKVRPDGHGIFTEDDATTAFFFEYDTGTETIARLVAKIGGYHDMARVIGNWWPVLFWLPTPARERHLHQALTAAGTQYPVATAVHRHPTRTTPVNPVGEIAANPAEACWWLHGDDGPVRRLADIATSPSES